MSVQTETVNADYPKRFAEGLCLECGAQKVFSNGVCRSDFIGCPEARLAEFAGIWQTLLEAKLNAMPPVERAKYWIGQSFKDGEHEMESGYPYPNPLNSRSQALVRAYKEQYDEAWLGLINYYPETGEERFLWKWDGESVCTFEATFVMPCFDEQTVELIKKYRREGFQKGLANIKALAERFYSLGGNYLHWN